MELRICKGNGGFGLRGERFLRFGWWMVTVLAVVAAKFTCAAVGWREVGLWKGVCVVRLVCCMAWQWPRVIR